MPYDPEMDKMLKKWKCGCRRSGENHHPLQQDILGHRFQKQPGGALAQK